MRLSGVLASLHRENSGGDLIEYGLIAAPIALGAVARMSFVDCKTKSTISAIGKKLENYIS